MCTPRMSGGALHVFFFNISNLNCLQRHIKQRQKSTILCSCLEPKTKLWSTTTPGWCGMPLPNPDKYLYMFVCLANDEVEVEADDVVECTCLWLRFASKLVVDARWYCSSLKCHKCHNVTVLSTFENIHQRKCVPIWPIARMIMMLFGYIHSYIHHQHHNCNGKTTSFKILLHECYNKELWMLPFYPNKVEEKIFFFL
jgi:hypothetical protein